MPNQQELQKLYQYSLALTNDPDDAYDLLQSALEKWVKSTATPTSLMAYLRRIIRNQFIDLCRRQQCIAFSPLEEQSPMLLSENVLEDEIIDSNLTERLMQHLSSAEREVLFLSAVMEYSASEIASELGSSRGTILSRLFRIKKKARSIATRLEQEIAVPQFRNRQ